MLILPIDKNWTDVEGGHEGGVSTGVGYTIFWQRGSLVESGRNGAFLIEVLESCRNQLAYYQDSSWACPENQEALDALNKSIEALQSRRSRREQSGVLGTQELD
jgi:hypothetical protein